MIFVAFGQRPLKTLTKLLTKMFIRKILNSKRIQCVAVPQVLLALKAFHPLFLQQQKMQKTEGLGWCCNQSAMCSLFLREACSCFAVSFCWCSDSVESKYVTKQTCVHSLTADKEPRKKCSIVVYALVWQKNGRKSGVIITIWWLTQLVFPKTRGVSQKVRCGRQRGAVTMRK